METLLIILEVFSSLSNHISLLIICIAILALIFRLLGFKKSHKSIDFSCPKLPALRPVRIETNGKSIFEAVKVWLGTRRLWEVAEDWDFKIGSTSHIIPKGFIFDGATIPRFLTVWFAPTGILLVGALVHDYLYYYEDMYFLSDEIKWERTGQYTRKDVDKLFRDISIDVNGFYSLNYIAYIFVRGTGWYYWNKYRKENRD